MSSKKPFKIMIMYTKAGGGHESIATGLADRLKKHFADRIEIKLEDPFGSLMDLSYQASVLFSPKFYNLFYSISKKSISIKVWRVVNELMQEGKLREIILEERPDLIISTHFLLSKEVKDAVKSEGENIPVVVYIADPFSMHPVWFVKEVDLYLSYDLEHLLKGKYSRMHEGKTIPIGMPLRKPFYQKYDGKKALEKIGFDPDKFTIMFGGSGSGMDNLERVIKPYLDLNLDCQTIFMCGKNTVLKKTLALLIDTSKNVKVLGYTKAESMAALMQGCDLFVGKVGPNVMFEAILSELPIVATPPILAQERGNRNYIREENIGYLTTSSKETFHTVERIVNDQDILKEKTENIIRLKKALIEREKKGTKDFMTWIENLIQKKREQAILYPEKSLYS